MPIIVVAAEKGGCGKTTAATNLAIHLARAGKDVLLLDVDPQASANNFRDRRNENHPELPVIHGATEKGDAARTIRDMAKRFEYVVVDAGGRNSLPYRSALRVADTLVVPLRPSRFDLETLDAMVIQLNELDVWARDIRVLLLFNQASTNPNVREVEAARAYVAQYPEFELIPTVLHDRKAYRDAGLAGLSVLETQNRAAAAEMELVANHIVNF